VHLIKLSVGSDSVESMAAWQARRAAQEPDGLPRHITRMWPKRADEILGQGSIYWVIQRQIQARQTILRFDEVISDDGIRRCAIVLDPQIHLVRPTPKRPFQGWRYLKPEDAPGDISRPRSGEEVLPKEMAIMLDDIGVIQP